MKTRILLLVIVAFLAITTVSAQRYRTVKESVNVGNFTSISASGGWDIIISQGNRQSVSIEISKDMYDYAIVEVKGSTLHISTDSNNRTFSWKNLLRGQKTVLKAYVTVTDLSKITTSGGVDIMFKTPLKALNFNLSMSGGSDLEDLALDCNSFRGDFSGGSDAEIEFIAAKHITVVASGGSDVELEDIDSESCRINGSGGCDLDLSGKTELLLVDGSGGCDISASRLVAKECEATFSGAADGEICVTDRLDINVSGAADVVCYGKPRVTETVDRSSSLRIR